MQPGRQRVVTSHELKVLSDEKDETEEGEEGRSDRCTGGGETGIAKHRNVEHWMSAARLNVHERPEQQHCTDESSDRTRA